MLDTYTEAQLRTIARDRTAQAEQATVGLSRRDPRPLGHERRLRLFRARRHCCVGRSPRAAGDGLAAVFSLELRRLEPVQGRRRRRCSRCATRRLRRATNDTLTFDVRLPTSGRLRLNPRLALSSRRYADGSSEQMSVAPMLRLVLRWPRRHQFELELGARQSTRELAVLGVEAPAARRGAHREIPERRLLVGARMTKLTISSAALTLLSALRRLRGRGAARVGARRERTDGGTRARP